MGITIPALSVRDVLNVPSGSELDKGYMFFTPADPHKIMYKHVYANTSRVIGVMAMCGQMRFGDQEAALVLRHQCPCRRFRQNGSATARHTAHCTTVHQKCIFFSRQDLWSSRVVGESGWPSLL